MNSGQLVSDEIVMNIVKELKNNSDTFMDGQFRNAPGLIFDGFPRTVK